MRRCPACGGFFDGDACPNTHLPDSDDILLPRLPAPLKARVGKIVTYDWPNSGPVYCIVTSEMDEDGKVGLMVLNEHVRVCVQDVEEI